MATVHDVAAAILARTGPMTAMKLQKLVYYAQAWHLVWEERPLFSDRIEAWANGPVVRTLYNQHRGQFHVSSCSGRPDALTAEETSTLESVIDFYGPRSAAWLSELTHNEAPWKDARANAGLAPGQRGDVEIDQAAMAEYYGSLVGTVE